MGLSDLIKFNVWTLEALDPGLLAKLEGQFQPVGGMEDGAPPVLASTVTAGSDRPAVQWVAGGQRVVRFRSSYVSLNELDDIRPKLDTLDALAGKDSSLGRAPRVSLTWGELEIEGFLILRKRITGWWPITGWPMRVDFEVEVREALELDLDGSGTGTGETQYLTLADGETFETLGARHLGSALRGDLIRRVNPSTAAGELPGDRVKVLERTHPSMRGTVRPTAPSLLDLTAEASLGVLLADLAADRGVETLGLAWARLPAVVAGKVA